MQHQRGFNLIELMVVVALVAIFAGIGVPSFREFMATQRVKNTAFDVAAVLLQARSEAIKRNAPVTIARSGDSWASGWTVQVGGTTLATREALVNVNITPAPDPDAASLDYQRNGRIASTMRFQVDGLNTTAVRCITISASGVPNTTSTSCS